MPDLDERLPERYINDVIDIARRAGDVILKYYKSGVEVQYKADNSPLTRADTDANSTIVDGLSRLAADLPVVSEELSMPDYRERVKWSCYWLIDPIDGTRSFVSGDGQFTVNIALILRDSPVLGVVHSPVENQTYWSVKGHGAFCMRAGASESEPIRVRPFSGRSATLIRSNRRDASKAEEFAANLELHSIRSKTLVSSSSIKFCRVAEGAVDVLLGFGQTSEWDTAAAQCVVEGAGGKVLDLDGRALIYNKKHKANPAFIAYGGGKVDWHRFVPDRVQTWSIGQ